MTFSNAEGTDTKIAAELKSSAPVNYNQVTVHDGKIFWKAGLAAVYGQMQLTSNSILSTTNGTNWTEVLPAENVSEGLRMPAFFSFQGKLWMAAGLAGRNVKAEKFKSSVLHSSDNGATWTEAETTGLPALAGATAVVNKSGKTAYLFGGVTADTDGTTIIANAKVYKSTDGIAWTAVETNANYTGRFSPAVVVDDNNIAWVFGRFALTLGYYGYSSAVDDVKANILPDVWAFALDE